MSRQIPTRSGSRTAPITAASSSKLRPTLAPPPAVFSSTIRTRCPRVRSWSTSMARATRSTPSASPVARCEPGWITTKGSPSASARSSSSWKTSTARCHSAGTGVARLMR